MRPERFSSGAAARVIAPAFQFPEVAPDPDWTQLWRAIVDHVAVSPDEVTREQLLESFHEAAGVRSLGFVNAHALNSCTSDKRFAADLLDLDYLVRDGVGVSALYRLIGARAGLNLNGTDLLPLLIARFAGQRVAVFGTREALAERVAATLRDTHGCATIVADGFRPDGYYLDAVARFRPDLIILGMGMPKQERVARLMKQTLRQDVGILCGGAILDFLSGHVSRAPLWMRRSGLEWVFRLGREPRRLFRRYVIGNPLFLLRSMMLARRGVPPDAPPPPSRKVVALAPITPFGIGGPVREAPRPTGGVVVPLRDPARQLALAVAPAEPFLAAVPRRASVFSASRPVIDRDALYGRGRDLDRLRARVLDARGSALIYGPRGYGKTSLVRVFGEVADSLGHLVIYAACSRVVDFSALMRPYLSELATETGMAPMPDEPLTVQAVAARLAELGDRSVVLILDEYDRIDRDDTRESVVELIKDVSDLTPSVRFVLVGVATDAAHILGYHPSVHRCLGCLPLTRLDGDAIGQLFRDKATADNLVVSDDLVRDIVGLSAGSAYHAQLIGQRLVADARRRQRMTVDAADLRPVVAEIVEDAVRIDPRLTMLAAEYSASPPLRDRLRTLAHAALADPDDVVRNDTTGAADDWLLAHGVLVAANPPQLGRTTEYRFANAFTPQLVAMLDHLQPSLISG